MTKTLDRLAEITEQTRLESVVSGTIDAAAIDAAWEQRVLPALSEYTRIPCLSPAFDPDWVERGAIAAAAELLRRGCATREEEG